MIKGVKKNDKTSVIIYFGVFLKNYVSFQELWSTCKYIKFYQNKFGSQVVKFYHAFNSTML